MTFMFPLSAFNIVMLCSSNFCFTLLSVFISLLCLFGCMCERCVFPLYVVSYGVSIVNVRVLYSCFCVYDYVAYMSIVVVVVVGCVVFQIMF